MADGNCAASAAPACAPLKRCTGCGQEKAPSEFQRQPRKPGCKEGRYRYGDGLRSKCRQCTKEMQGRWRARQSPEYRVAVSAKAVEYQRQMRAAGKKRTRRKKRTWHDYLQERVNAAAKRGKEYWPRGLGKRWRPPKPAPLPKSPRTRKPWNDPALTVAQKWKLRYSLDPEFRAREYGKALRYKRARRALMARGVDQVRVELFRIQAGSCAYCAVALPNVTDRQIEHVMPISKGGTHDWGNLAVVCQPCNQSKWNRLPTAAEKRAALRQRSRHDGMQRVLV